MEKTKIIAFAGSLRKGSFNKMLLNEAQKLTPANMQISIFDLSEIPLFNADLENEKLPDAVKKFRNAIPLSDGIIMAAPEHNGTISAVLKNALEWASRRNSNHPIYPEKQSPLYKKPVAFVGASTSQFATIRAQTHLLYLCTWMQMRPMSKPNLMVAHAQNYFNEKGELVDEKIKNKLRGLLTAFQDWVNGQIEEL